MRSFFLFTICLAVSVSCASTKSVLFSRTNQASTPEITSLIHQMTLEEKVGQMTQLTMMTFAPTKYSAHQKDAVSIDREALKKAIGTYHIGSFFNVVDVIGDSAETPAAWRQLMTTLDQLNNEHSRLKIPILFGIDAVHGANYTRGASIFAHPIGQAATFDRSLVAQVAAITAKDVAASGIPWNFSPVLDVARQPLWSRTYETFGEQSWLVRELGRSAVAAHSASLPCLKHYLAYGAPRSGQDRTPALVGERMMRELYLPPFAAAVAAGAPAIMVNSGTVDGVPLHASTHWLTDVLRGELGFEGVVVSDWEDIARLHTRDHVADSPKEAVRLGVMAGIDMSMVPDNYMFTQLLIELVQEDKVPMARIDEAVGRILNLKAKAHLLGPEPQHMPPVAQVGTIDDNAVNLQVAKESLTLLKNTNDLLPLSPNAHVMVAGPQADSLSALAGGWTYTWQGGLKEAFHHERPTLLEAIRTIADAGHVTYAKTTAQAVVAAKKADIAVVCIGEAPYAEGKGNIQDLTLDEDQLDLVRAIQATQTPVVLILVEGRPRIIRPVVDQAHAILMAYLPGFEGGTAIAETLYGRNNPSGRLPITYPRATGNLVLSDALHAESSDKFPLNPEWALGTGLSYTSFKVSDLKVNPNVKLGDNIQVYAKVTNIGARTGRHSVLLYLSDRYASTAQPKRQVRGFTKVELKPQQSQDIFFELKPYDLSFINEDNRRVVEPGEFDVFLEDQMTTFRVYGTKPYCLGKI